MTQPNLFIEGLNAAGFASAIEKAFTEAIKPTPKQKRLAAAAAVHDKEDELWRQTFRAFVLKFAATNKTFTPEAVRHAYTAAKLPAPRNWRSSGQLFKKLAQEGFLKIVGMSEAKDYGCPTRLYAIGERREEKQFSSLGK